MLNVSIRPDSASIRHNRFDPHTLIEGTPPFSAPLHICRTTVSDEGGIGFHQEKIFPLTVIAGHMDIPQQIQPDHSTVRVSAQPGGDAVMVVHRETLLSDMPPRGQNQFVLVADDDGRFIGVVASDEIDKRLLSSNAFERTRWGAMPIGTMSKLSFSDSRVEGPKLGEEFDCSAIRQGDRLFGLCVDGDLFFSWKRLESLFSEALSDPLTGLMNRLAYERRLREEWSRSLRTDTSIGVVVVDLDDFKAVNDTYGHTVGDQVLVEVAKQLEKAMRSYDVVARFGGDEFVALCLGCGPHDIDIPVTRIQKNLDAIRVVVEGREIAVSASIGAAVRHCDFDNHLPEDLFVAADNCLYEAKDSKRNAWKIEITETADSKPEPIKTDPSTAIQTNSSL